MVSMTAEKFPSQKMTMTFEKNTSPFININVLFDREVCPSFWEGLAKLWVETMFNFMVSGRSLLEIVLGREKSTIFLLCGSRHPFNRDNSFLESLGKNMTFWLTLLKFAQNTPSHQSGTFGSIPPQLRWFCSRFGENFK